MVTEGLKQRCQQLFGPVTFLEGYAMTETIPFGGSPCSEGHLHFEASHGLLEVIDPETARPAALGEPGTIVATPFAPYRETTILLRYDTEDMVRPLAAPLTCSLRNLPVATSDVLGKRRLSVRHDDGWTFPRDVLEALESSRRGPAAGAMRLLGGARRGRRGGGHAGWRPGGRASCDRGPARGAAGAAARAVSAGPPGRTAAPVAAALRPARNIVPGRTGRTAVGSDFARHADLNLMLPPQTTLRRTLVANAWGPTARSTW